MSTFSFRVGILGATGAVGQRFVSLLENHPWFHVTCLGASERSAGKMYKSVVNWKLPSPLPESCASLEVTACTPDAFKNCCDLVFSGLDASVAGDIEIAFAASGLPVFSNAKNHRYDANVPILIPLINADHLEIIRKQPTFETSGGFIVTNANCSSTGLSIALAPLHYAFGGISHMFVSTLQAISGAGYPGLPSLDILDNVVPYISGKNKVDINLKKEKLGEEEKLELEPNKILGTRLENFTIQPATMRISATCHRVAVSDGHTVSVSLKFNVPSLENDIIENAIKAWDSWTVPADVSQLPSCPKKVVLVRHEPDRPQPRLDRDEGNGMTTVIGRVRKCPLLNLRFTTTRAAGGSILNAELAVFRGYVKLLR